MLAVEDNKTWYPIFLIVDDNKSTNYIFNYKNLNLKSKNEYQRNWFETNFIGYKVTDSISKNKREGSVIDIIERHKNGFPKYVIVEWSDGLFTKEFMVYSKEQVNQSITIKRDSSKIIVNELKKFTELDNRILDYKITNSFSSNNGLPNLSLVDNYNGKYRDEKRINWGASPGARASVEQEYFSLQRLYDVDLSLIVNYINSKRIDKGLTKTDLTNLFPVNYKHTVGHWLRKDFGGSLPTPEDWCKLSDILDFDKRITNYVCKKALTIQTVKHGEYKMPNDFIQKDFIKKLELLIYT